ncbi:hypothetical protein C6P40_005211 [Pichia californica]|uniref:Uncharacterized protein n=1 Tax=Pichia californica TaxID=460514 RepID=A0A9P6WLI3_9ASCO|nr:hypothetical protein C6P40_005211 [[Candida] californica]
MAVYGKLKRKVSLKRNLSLSPTKHHLNEYNSDLSSSQQTLFSSYSSINASQSKTNSSDSIVSDLNTEIDFESQDTVVDDNDNDQSSPFISITKPEKSTKLNTLFEGFSTLENDILPINKKKKISLVKYEKITTTTIFNKNKNKNIKNEEKIIDSDTSVVLSDDEFSSKISLSLNQLNHRLSELESKLKVSSNGEEIILNPDSNVFITTTTSDVSKRRTYGGNRSFKIDSETLSEEEEDHNNLNDNEDQLTENIAILKNSETKNKCKSMEELRLSGELEGIKFEYEMMINNIEHELLLISNKRDPLKLLFLKLDLFNKFKSDNNFDSYLRNNIIEKHNSHFYKVICKLLKQSPNDLMINFQLITYFKIQNINQFEMIFQDSFDYSKDETINEYAKRNVKLTGKLMKDTVNDWIKYSNDSTVYQIILEMILSIDLFTIDDNENKSLLLNFLNLSLKSTNDKIKLLSLNILRSNIKLQNLDIMITLSELINNTSIDSVVYNILLEYIILVICNSELPIKCDTNKLIFSQNIFSKLISIVKINNVITSQGLSLSKQNQCLYALGYLFSFINSDYEITDSSTIIEMLPFLEYLNQHQEDEFNILQIHCIGYFGCIWFHFLNKFKLFTFKLKQQIKNILNLYKKLEKNKSDETLYKEIARLLNSSVFSV